jgi:hypothetical protein
MSQFYAKAEDEVFTILDNPTAGHGAGSDDRGEAPPIFWNCSGG